MREILFRGKRKENDEWVFGDLIHEPWASCIQVMENDNINTFKFKRTKYSVHKETVGQYTGLTDKNGVKIFEGDIVTIPDSKKMGLPALIRYDYVRATYEVSRSGYNPLSLIDAREFYEVIGNIHDNPELLKEGGE